MSTISRQIITLHLPWAYWVFRGWKTIETRKHPRFECLLGKRIGIHASKTWDENAIAAAAEFLIPSMLKETEEMRREFFRYEGHILCTVDVHAFRALTELDARAAMIECKTKRFGLFLTNVNPLKPFIAKRGNQGIWRYHLPLAA